MIPKRLPPTFRARCQLAGLIPLTALCFQAAMAARIPLSLVAVSGTPAPDRGADFKNLAMIPPVAGRGGVISFAAGVNYTGAAPPLSVNRYTGIYQGEPGDMHWTNPGGPYSLAGNTYFLPQNVPSINSSGQNLVTAAFVDNPAGGYPPISGYGVMLGSGASAQLIYRVGDPAPGLPGVTLFEAQGAGNGVDDDSLNLNNSGRVTLQTRLSGTGINGTNNSAIYFTDTPGSLTKVARTGDPAPGGGTFSALGPPATADDGSIVFGARIAGDFFDSIFTRTPAGVLQSLAKNGDPATAAGDGAIFSAMPSAGFQIPVRADGSAAFVAGYTQGALEQAGVFLGKPGALEAVATDSTPAPGTVGNFFISANSHNVGTSLRINDNGTVVFIANWYRPSPYAYGAGIFARRNGTLVPLVLSGSPAVDGPPGATFQAFTTDQIVLNNQDQLVFQANMTGGGTSGGNQSAIWGLDLVTGALGMIVRNKEMLEISQGNTVQVSGISSYTSPHRPRGGGSGTALSDNGRYVFEFTTQSGPYIIMTADFPAPASRIETWRQTYFGSPANSGPGADTAISGPDGLPNLIHYALGISPFADARSDGSAPLASVSDIGGTNYGQLAFILDPAAGDIRLAVSASTDLEHWDEGNVYQGAATSADNAVTQELSRETLPDGRQRITVRTIAAAGHFFFRIGVID